MRRDLEYIKNPMQWTGWICPLVRRHTTGVECAYLFSKLPVLKHGNIYNPREEDRREEFKTHEDILLAGWVVD